jgi:hypothetical protein
MMMMFHHLLLLLPFVVTSFQQMKINNKNVMRDNRVQQEQQQSRQPSPHVLFMGLYDKPLPPPPPSLPKNNDDNNKGTEETDDEVKLDELPLLFEMNKDGTERNGYLQPLVRRIDTAGCYYGPSDRIVQKLSKNANCHPSDAAWALESTRADIQEAWMRINVARRTELAKRSSVGENTPNNHQRGLEKEMYDLQIENEYEPRKANREEEEDGKRISKNANSNLPDQQWLPTKNPTPTDDEPWFTG